ncbi:MAG: diadenylate cyclase CdaA [Verrucomicrobiota bacterium]
MIEIAPYWRGIIEILILATGFYYTWILFRGTRGVRVLIGMALLIIGLKAISAVLGLTVIDELLQPFFAFFFLALIIIFQPEIRRILAEVGSRPLRRGAREQIATIEAVIDAIEYLRRERFGAIIAFEKQGIYEHGHDTGTPVDADVTSDLIATIFYPKTPLHDGGIIIRNNRILTAAAIFPLTSAEDLQRTLGLRHRAALGLSEETDAVIVVLSEETGIISLAHDGKLVRGLSTDELRDQLNRRLSDAAPPPPDHPKEKTDANVAD